jgi:hypothetical protein
MRVLNPNVASPVTAQDKSDLQNVLATLAGRHPTFDEIRTALPADRRARFTDGMIHQAALDLGLKVRSE